jgi:IS5 family transposase
VVFADAGYQGVEKRPEQARSASHTWHVAMRPGKRKALGHDAHGRMLERIEKLKASVRAKVEHPFHVVKNLFKMRKVRYRGLAKNTAQLTTLFGMANLVLVKRRLFELDTLNPS